MHWDKVLFRPLAQWCPLQAGCVRWGSEAKSFGPPHHYTKPLSTMWQEAGPVKREWKSNMTFVCVLHPLIQDNPKSMLQYAMLDVCKFSFHNGSIHMIISICLIMFWCTIQKICYVLELTAPICLCTFVVAITWLQCTITLLFIINNCLSKDDEKTCYLHDATDHMIPE